MTLRSLNFPLFLSAALLGGCLNLSPDYAPPPLHTPMPSAYKEEGGWKMATPGENLDRGNWWEDFRDPVLNGLIRQADAANQDLAVAAANLREARAQIAVARSALMPGVSLPASLTRSGSEGSSPGTNYSFGVSAQWEISFWNALPALEAAKYTTEASAADLATIRLAVRAELAQSYFQLRVFDAQSFLLEETADVYAKAVALTRSRYRGGLVTPLDVAQAEAQLADAQAQLAALQRQRAAYEHAVAVLAGQAASSFSLPAAEFVAEAPSVPPGVPSGLLERRPDIAAAERRAAAANQQIGLTRAAWFPSLTLGASYLGEGTGWLTAPVYTWSVGPSAVLEIFQGGGRLAQSDAARAAYEAEVGAYRQTVLVAVREVEDALSALRYLEKESAERKRALDASREALRLAMSQYRGGMTTYLDVVSSQNTVLENERSVVNLRGERLAASVGLIKALGGGWRVDDMSSALAGNEPAPLTE